MNKKLMKRVIMDVQNEGCPECSRLRAGMGRADAKHFAKILCFPYKALDAAPHP
jgi:hypothetical protein